MKKKIKVIVECGKDLYSCYSDTPIGNVKMISGDGHTVDEAKQDFMLCVEECRQAYPDDRSFDDLEFDFRYDISSFFDNFKVLNVSEVARRAGISLSSMRQYTGGRRNASESTYKRLSACVGEIKHELSLASF